MFNFIKRIFGISNKLEEEKNSSVGVSFDDKLKIDKDTLDKSINDFSVDDSKIYKFKEDVHFLIDSVIKRKDAVRYKLTTKVNNNLINITLNIDLFTKYITTKVFKTPSLEGNRCIYYQFKQDVQLVYNGFKNIPTGEVYIKFNIKGTDKNIFINNKSVQDLLEYIKE